MIWSCHHHHPYTYSELQCKHKIFYELHTCLNLRIITYHSIPYINLVRFQMVAFEEVGKHISIISLLVILSFSFRLKAHYAKLITAEHLTKAGLNHDDMDMNKKLNFTYFQDIQNTSFGLQHFTHSSLQNSHSVGRASYEPEYNMPTYPQSKKNDERSFVMTNPKMFNEGKLPTYIYLPIKTIDKLLIYIFTFPEDGSVFEIWTSIY